MARFPGNGRDRSPGSYVLSERPWWKEMLLPAAQREQSRKISVGAADEDCSLMFPYPDKKPGRSTSLGPGTGNMVRTLVCNLNRDEPDAHTMVAIDLYINPRLLERPVLETAARVLGLAALLALSLVFFGKPLYTRAATAGNLGRTTHLAYLGQQSQVVQEHPQSVVIVNKREVLMIESLHETSPVRSGSQPPASDDRKDLEVRCLAIWLPIALGPILSRCDQLTRESQLLDDALYSETVRESGDVADGAV